jgi:cysteine-rich repeat protein
VDGGMVCWGAPGISPPDPSTWDRTVFNNYVDCVAYGTYAGPSNALIGTPHPLDPVGHSLERVALGADNASNFACADPAGPENNAPTAASLPATTPCPFCGDGVVSGPEICDDGNTVSGDGCSSQCIPEVCGDGIVEPGTEECDDGNTFSGDGCDGSCVCEPDICGDGALQCGESCDDGNTVECDGCGSDCQHVDCCGNGSVEPPEECDDGNTASGDGCTNCALENGPPDKAQQACVNELNKRGAGVSKALGKNGTSCVKGIAKGKVSDDLATCLRDDAKGKIGKAEQKTTAGEAKKCVGVTFTIGQTDSVTVNHGAGHAGTAPFEEVFGVPDNVALKSADGDGAGCQLEVAKALQKTVDKAQKEGLKAKKDALKGKKVPQVDSASELGNAIALALAGEAIAKQGAKNDKKIGAKCVGADLPTLFPGVADTGSPAAFSTSVTGRAVCAACLFFRDADALPMNCDLVDDGQADASCVPET